MRGLAAPVAAVLALGCGCAHVAEAPAAAPPPERSVLWPAPPAAPRVRLVGSVTLATPPGARRWWKTALRWLAGAPSDGSDADLLARPFDVALLGDGSFVVADPDRPGVLSYAPDGSVKRELTCKNHPWASPISVAAAADGAIWVADAAAPAIVRWSASGCRVLAPEGIERPTGIAVTGARIVVVDPPMHQVVSLSEDGAVVARVGRRGDGEGEFNYPTDVAAAPDGSLYVVDALNFRVVHLRADGGWIDAFGTRGGSGAALARPKGIDADGGGLVWVSDAQRDVVLVFRPGGSLEYLVGQPGSAPGEFAHPAGLSARGGRLVVADSVNRRAAMFEVLGENR
ncbi:MAG TPA: hypothetical protein VFL83_22100 [Anaeromyxobacter sp.]|nr:hypothetical protein [Anaeromyxobacter sp.]